MASLSPRDFTKAVFDSLLRATGPGPSLLVAYSGGLDSTALAHMLVTHRARLAGLRLAHVNHGLQAASREWSAHCRRQARQWQVPLMALDVQVAAKGQSLEAAAREARYAALARALRPGEILVTAQHRDDQVETVLLQLLRGAGIPGLAAMPYQAPFARGQILRPLLPFPRTELQRYARHHDLAWCEDPSNQSDRFDRNYLRNQVMPLLRQRWQGLGSAISRSSRHMAEAAQLLDASANRDLLHSVDGDALHLPALRRLPELRRKAVLRLFIARSGVDMPPESKLLEIVRAMLAARADAQPEVRWSGAVLRRRAGRLELHVIPQDHVVAEKKRTPESWRWQDDREFALSSAGEKLSLVDDPAGPIDLARLPRLLQLRPRQGGESLRPAPSARTQTLKKLLQAARLTVEERARLPLLFGEGPKGRLLAVGDRWLDASVRANVKSRRRARLVWKRND